MLWKSLSGLSAAILAIGLLYSYKAKISHAQERDLYTRSQSQLESVEKEISRASQLKVTKEKEIEELRKKREAINAEFQKLASERSIKNRELEANKTNLEEVKKQLAQLEEKINLAGDIGKLQKEIRELNKEKEQSESSLASVAQQLSLADSRIKEAQNRTRQVVETDARQKRGIVDSNFTAKVSQSFLEHGFVILNKGNSQGVFANAMLDVRRGRDVVARLKVRNVEADSAIAELVPGSGSSVRTGDVVVASAVQPSAVAAPTSESAPAAAANASASPEALAAPAAAEGDPFASPAAMPAPAPAGADPFASPAATPAPAPASDDPFAAPAAPAPAPAPAPAAPMAPAGDDPFGAPAAPAAPAAPMAPGTSAAPAEKDPFSMQ